MECDDEGIGERCYLVGEEEAIWLLRLVLPYINEVLLNLRSLFSGEPVTTMKVGKNRERKVLCLHVNIRQKQKREKHCTIWYSVHVVSGILRDACNA